MGAYSRADGTQSWTLSGAMVILSQDRARMHFFLRQWWAQVVHLPKQHQLRLSIDVDPQEFN